MANEWTKVELYGANRDGEPRRYTIAAGLSVSKGQTLTLVDNRTVVIASGAVSAGAGVASEDHIAGFGVTSISVWTDIIGRAVASGSILVGDSVSFCENNEVVAAGFAASGAKVVGYTFDGVTEDDALSVRLRL